MPVPEARRAQVGVSIKGSAVFDGVRGIRERFGDESYRRIVAAVDEETRALLESALVPTGWYPLDPFLRFLEAALHEVADGNELALVQWTETIIERQLTGIYRLFVRLGSPEFVLKRISVIHMNYYNGVHLEAPILSPGRAVLRYVGFEPRHRLMGHSIVGFFRKALEISGARNVAARFEVPIEAGKGYAELVVTWRG